MNIETKLVITLNNPQCSTQDLRLELKMSEAEDLYNKLKEIFNKQPSGMQGVSYHRGLGQPIGGIAGPVNMHDFAINCTVVNE